MQKIFASLAWNFTLSFKIYIAKQLFLLIYFANNAEKYEYRMISNAIK
jgi:hypothetical protein